MALQSDVLVTLSELDSTLAPEGTDLNQSQKELQINTAHHVVEQFLEGKGINSDLLSDIERLLAAHFARIQDRDVDSQTVNQDQRDYQGETGMNFNATTYGQQAQTLDPTNSLKEANDESTSYRFDVFSERSASDVAPSQHGT